MIVSYEGIHRSVDVITDGLSSYRVRQNFAATAADHNNQTDEPYSFDANGNRNMTGHTVGSNNRLTTDGTYNYSYDNEGNRILRGDLRGQGKRRDKTGWELRMKESYREGLASRSGPESYAGGGNIAGVATAGVRAGQPLSSEITHLACRPRPDKGKATSTLALLASRRRTRRSLRTWACAETSIARTGRSWELPWGAVRPHQRGTVGERHRR
jgi:hypothetical protein